MAGARVYIPASTHAIAEVLTVGLPFCAFKILTGIAVFEVGPLLPLAVALLVLGGIDLTLNLFNLVARLARRTPIAGVCLLDVLARRRTGSSASPDLGVALDVFVSFALVAAVIGFGLLGHLPPWGLVSWNVAVVVNVLGAGLGRLVPALRR